MLKIANNILQNSEEKFRKLKSTNKMLKEKVLNARGGHEYLIAVSLISISDSGRTRPDSVS